ncbi:MAG: response regulator, partial [Deltaproteobacteria bacterium]
SIHFVARNVTEKKRLEEELFEAQKMKAIGTLAGGIAHDFNNIMATVLGYASYLRGKVKKDDPFYKGLVAIEKSAVRASELTGHLLAYSRKGKLEIKPINLNIVVKDVNEIISGIFEKSIKIVLTTEHNLENIEGDITQMKQIVMNLAINAREAMPEGGILKIQTFMEDVESPIYRAKYTIEAGRYVCLKVSDNGVGMDKHTESRIFEPYFSTKTDKTSTGLGMSVVYGIIKGHSGYIEIDTEPGRGTDITVYIPASTEKTKVEDEEIKEWTGGLKTIMIIDDEGAVLSMLTSILTDAGFWILGHTSGRSAVNVFKEKADEIDLVILDVIMPDMNGEEVLKELLKIDKKARVLLASGYSHEEQHHELLQLGASGFIGKPFVINMLMDKISRILG